MSNIELFVGLSWVFAFPIIVYLMNRYFKSRNNDTSFPQIYVSGIVFYAVGFYPAMTLILS